MKKKYEEAVALWNENKTKVFQVVVVGIVSGFAVRTAYKLGDVHGTVRKLAFVKERVPEAYKLIKEYVDVTVVI